MGLREESGWTPYTEENKSELRKAKGVRYVVVKDLRHKFYKQYLFEQKEFRHPQVGLRRHRHQIGL